MVLIALTTEIACDQTAMGLPPATSAIFLITPPKRPLFTEITLLVKSGRLGGISDMSATPSGIKREWYVYECRYLLAWVM
jgi:hypothetical protein